MINWRDVRSQTALTDFLVEFQRKPVSYQEKTLQVMRDLIEEKRKEDIREGITVEILRPQQVEKPLVKTRRPRRQR